MCELAGLVGVTSEFTSDMLFTVTGFITRVLFNFLVFLLFSFLRGCSELAVTGSIHSILKHYAGLQRVPKIMDKMLITDQYIILLCGYSWDLGRSSLSSK